MAQEVEAGGGVGGAHLAGLVVEEARQHGDAAGAQRAAHGGSERDQRAGEDVGEHEVDREEGARGGVIEARGGQHADAARRRG